MSIRVIAGNLLKYPTDILIHGCNCFHLMGGGIASQIKNFFPEAYSVDKATIYGLPSKLGTISYTKMSNPTIINAYTQYGYSSRYKQADYDAIRKSFKEIKQKYTGQLMSIPLIGAGLAGGDWTVILSIIMDELSNENVTIVVWDGDPNVDQIIKDTQSQLDTPVNVSQSTSDNLIHRISILQKTVKSKTF